MTTPISWDHFAKAALCGPDRDVPPGARLR